MGLELCAFRAALLAVFAGALGSFVSAAEWKLERTLGETGFQHGNSIVEIIPLSDGMRVVTASRDGTARLWELESGRELQRYWRKECDSVWGVRVLPGEKEVLVSGADGYVTRYDLASGEQRMTYRHTRTVYRMDLRPGGKEFVACDNDNLAILWNLETGEKVQIFKGHTDGVYTVAFISGGKRLLTGCSDGKLKVWDVATGECEKTLGKEDVYTIAISPDEKKVAVCFNEDQVDVYDAETLERLWRNTKSGEMKVVTWSRDGQFVTGVNSDAELMLLDVEDGNERKIQDLPDDTYWGIAYSEDGSELLVGCDGVLGRFSADSGERVVPALGIPVFPHAVRKIAVSGDGGMVMAADEQGKVHVWDSKKGDLKRSFLGLEETKYYSEMVLSPDGQTLAMGGEDGEVVLLDVKTGKRTKTISDGVRLKGTIRALEFSPSGEFLAISSTRDNVLLWNLAGERVERELRGHGDEINSFSFAGQGETLFAASDDDSIHVWNVKDGKEIKKLSLEDKKNMEKVCHLSGGSSYLVSNFSETLYGFVASAREKRERLGKEEIEELVSRLRAESFAERRDASERLVEEGSWVLPLLEKMQFDDPEVVFRLREIRTQIRKSEVRGDLAELHHFDDSIKELASDEVGVHWAAVVGRGVISQLVIGTVEDEALKILDEERSGNGPVKIQFSGDGKSLVTGNQDGTISVYRYK